MHDKRLHAGRRAALWELLALGVGPAGLRDDGRAGAKEHHPRRRSVARRVACDVRAAVPSLSLQRGGGVTG